jgi:hypothetical protein
MTLIGLLGFWSNALKWHSLVSLSSAQNFLHLKLF